MLVDATGYRGERSIRQRWAHAVTIIVALLTLGYGLNQRQSTLMAVTRYSDIQSGITAFYPANWLLDTTGDYVFRVQDTQQPGFKTTIQIAVEPVSPATTGRNIADRLALTRARTLTDYNVLEDEPFTLTEDSISRLIEYTYVSRQTGPFLEGIPSVVIGQDILTITRGQVIIITFRAESAIYAQEYPKFERFLETLDF